MIYPESKYTLKAYLELGKIYSKDKKWNKALSFFKQIVEQFSQSEFCADIYFRMADIIQFKTNDKKKALPVYRELIEKYPESSWVKYAQMRIKELEEELAKQEDN